LRSALAPVVMLFGASMISFGLIAGPSISYADGGTGTACNEGGDPSMPKGCMGWCYSPKTCEAHPIRLVCTCR
jgi:hypothetical protein